MVDQDPPQRRRGLSTRDKIILAILTPVSLVFAAAVGIGVYERFVDVRAEKAHERLSRIAVEAAAAVAAEPTATPSPSPTAMTVADRRHTLRKAFECFQANPGLKSYLAPIFAANMAKVMADEMPAILAAEGLAPDEAGDEFAELVFSDQAVFIGLFEMMLVESAPEVRAEMLNGFL